MATTTKNCPRCNAPLDDVRYALSRKDNTPICSQCGTEEALEDYFNRGVA